MLLEMSQAHANALYIWLGSKWTGVLNIPVTYPQCILLLGRGYHFWITDVCLTLFRTTPILHSEDLTKMKCGLRKEDRQSPTFTDRRCSKFIVLNSAPDVWLRRSKYLLLYIRRRETQIIPQLSLYKYERFYLCYRKI